MDRNRYKTVLEYFRDSFRTVVLELSYGTLQVLFCYVLEQN